ncbi:MAG: ABC transporter permease, partial [Hyphomicrobiales bacterium]|nr:ABC transporter permease [Hyphomicrobiales bacterium]
MTSSRAVLRLARRDLRGGLAGLGTFVGCVALGTMAIVAVGSVAASLRAGVAAQGREIVGADAAFSFAGRPPPPGFRAFLATRGATAGIALTTAMARAADGAAAPVAVKAVGPSWPTVGAATFEPAMSAGQALAPRDGAFGAAAEDTLFARLGLKVGDEIKLGAATLRMNAALRAEPDSLAAGIGFAPRLLISRGALAASGLLGPGALYTSVERALLPAGADDRAVARLVADAKRAFPDAGFVARTRLDAAPEFASDLARFAQFLELVGLSSLLVGGVGVANAATAFVARKRDTLATLKALGASGAAAFAIVGAQAAAIAALGIAIGLAAGAALPFALAAFGGTLIPFPLRAAVYPAELARGAAFGALSAAAFALPPLGRAHDAPVQALFRGEAGGARGRPRRAYLAAALACALALAGFAVVTAPDRRLAAYFLAAALGAFLALRALGFGMTRLARRLPRPRGFAARLALSNLHRPGAPTTTVVVSLGLGLALLVALAGIDETLHGAIAGAAPAGAPSFFFVDVKPAEADAFDAFLARAAPGAARRRAPLLRGRIVEIAGAPADPAKVDPDVRWMLRGDRGLTTSEGVPDGSRVTAGAWWPKGYSGPPLVSLDGTAARGLGVKVGDEIGVDVLGRRIRAKVANLRKVDWKRVGVNFILVFPPSAFAGAPHT